MFNRLTVAFDLASDRYPNSRRNRRRKNSGRKNRGKKNGALRLSVETLEPRVMLAADVLSQAVVSQDYTPAAVETAPADFDNNGYVDGDDLAQWEGNFGSGVTADADDDGDSDGADFLAWQRQFTGSQGTAGVVGPNLADGTTHFADSGNFTANGPASGLWDTLTTTPGTSSTTNSFWVEYDLGQLYDLSQSRFFGDADGTWDSDTYNLKVKSAAGDAYTSIITGANAHANQWFETSFTGTQARFVRLEVFGSPGTQALEFEVYGTVVASGPNLADGATYFADSENFTANGPASGLWDTLTTTPGTVSTSGSFWVEYDLGQLYDLSQSRFFGDADGTWVSDTYNLKVKSAAGDAYTSIITGADAFANQWLETSFTGTQARFVRLEVFGGSGAQALEFEVYGTVATGDTQAPSVPTNLNATAVSSSQIDLTWTASTDNVGVTGYTIFRNGSPIVPNVTTTTFQDTGLASSTSYTYTVLAFDAAGNNSSQSAEDSATTLANLANLADSATYFADSENFTANGPASGLWDTLTTTPGTVSTSGSFWVEYDLGQLYDLSQSRFFGDADGTWVSDTYNLKVKSAAGDAYTSIITGADAFANQWLETSFTGTQARFVRLEVFGGSGAQALEFEVYGTVATGDTQAPSVPTNLNATAVSSSQIDLTWTASTDNVGVTGYTIFRNGSPIVPNVTTTTFQDTGRDSSTPYTYTVLAFDAAGNNSPQSAADSATTLANLANLADGATHFADSGNFTVGNPVSGLWDTLTTTPGTVSTSGSFWVEYDLGQLYDLSQSRFFGDADGTWVSDTYNLKVKSAAGDAYTSIITGADAFANQWLETSFTGTQARFVRLEVFGGSGAQALEFEVYGTVATGDTQAPSVPTNLNATAVSSSQIDLTWTASNDNVGVTGYTIFRNGSPIVPNVTTTTFQDTGLNSSTPYTYTVLAFDAAGNNSPQSAADSATTLAQSGNIFYIAPTGSDTTGTGTISNPYFSLEKIHDDIGLNPGDIIYARGGTYNWVGSDGGNGMKWTAQGTAAEPITVMAYPGETPVFDGGSSGKNRNFVSVYNGDHVIFDGLEITNYLDAFSLNCDVYKACTDNLEDLTIRNNYIHDTSTHSIYIRTGTEDIKIYNNFFEDPGGHKDGAANDSNPDAKYGIHVWHGPGTVGLEIYNNVFVDTYGGILLAEDATDVNIYNNTFYDNHFGVRVWGGEAGTGGQGITNVAMRNNVFYMTPQGGPDFAIWMDDDSELNDLVTDNNLFYNDAGAGVDVIYWGPSSTFLTLSEYVSLTTNGDNSVEVDPLLTTLGSTKATSDFSLQAASPAIDLGRSPLVAPFDFAGNSRPQGSDYDIGAYEFLASSALLAPEGETFGSTTGEYEVFGDASQPVAAETLNGVSQPTQSELFDVALGELIGSGRDEASVQLRPSAPRSLYSFGLEPTAELAEQFAINHRTDLAAPALRLSGDNDLDLEPNGSKREDIFDSLFTEFEDALIR